MEEKELQEKALEVRKNIIKMIYEAKSGHPGGSLSMVEILIALYFSKMNIDTNNKGWENRDRLVLSKGHGAPALYAVLAERGYFDKEELISLRKIGSRLQGHPDLHKLPGVDASTGSLGQGISIAVGMALGAKLKKAGYNIYCIIGDGEAQEGQVWEACMSAAHYNLDNFTLILDYNKLQIDGTNNEVMSLGDVYKKFESFGFEVLNINGNEFEDIFKALDSKVNNKPKCIIAETVKGKGVSFMENCVGWHGKAPNNEEMQLALEELGRS